MRVSTFNAFAAVHFAALTAAVSTDPAKAAKGAEISAITNFLVELGATAATLDAGETVKQDQGNGRFVDLPVELTDAAKTLRPAPEVTKTVETVKPAEGA